MFSSLGLRYEQFISVDHAEDHHAAVAAASVVAKVLRDDRFNAIRARYEPELGPITVDCDILKVQGADLRLIVYTAPPGTTDAEALAELGMASFRA